MFYSSPINITDLCQKVLKFNGETIFVDSLPQKKVWEYFQKRLGLDAFQMQAVELKKEKQRDLFSFLEVKSKRIKLEIKPMNLKDSELLEYSSSKFLPTALIFGSVMLIKSFYHTHYRILKKTAFVLAQGGAGGDSRILRNFMIHKESLLLASSKFILKSLIGKGAGTFLGNLSVKTLVVGHLPFEQYTHPYLEAVSKQFGNPFEDFSLPRALINFHNIIKFFHTPTLKIVVVADPKLNKPYSKAFLDYLSDVFI
ncbi:MAG: hypothetical protein HYZ51_04405 [Candidatus Doudnabacteria bacterium]|nr:hypothetical protein [Candidatus Doudnabacteria bacterium]